MAQIATFYDHIKDIARQEGISLTDAMLEAKKLGIELLEISQNNIIGREDEVGRELSYTGLGISSIPSYFDFGRNTDVDRQSGELLDAARYLGAKKLLVIPGFYRPEDDEAERERQIVSIIRCLDELGDKAAKDGIELVMEDFDSELAPYSTIEGVSRFVTRCKSLSACFDTGNFRYSAQDELEAYDTLRGKIGHVHLKDRAYTPQNGENGKRALDGRMLYPVAVGGGALKLKEIVARLRADGYNGAYTIEHYDSNDMLGCLTQSAAWVKEQLQ